MSKIRISEIAKELGLKSKDVVEKAQTLGLDVKSHANGVTSEEAELLANYIMTGEMPKDNQAQTPQTKTVASKKVIKKAEQEEKKDKTEDVKEIEQKVENKEEKINTNKDEPKEDQSKSIAKKQDNLGKAGLAANSLRSRRKGLTIVKKKKKSTKSIEEEKRKLEERISSDYGKVKPEVLAEIANKKKKNKQVSIPAQKKSQGNKLDIFQDIGEFSSDLMESEEVVLLDFRDQNLKEEREEREKILQEEHKKNQKKYNEFNKNSQKKSGGRKHSLRRDGLKKRIKSTPKDEDITHIEIPEDIRVYEFAEKINKSTGDVIKVLFLLGLVVTKNDFLDKDQLEILADEFDIEVTVTNPKDEFDYVSINEDDMEEANEDRPPVITIMGHVDHGKTSLLDYIRNAKVADKEAGGITQHIGAYSIVQDGKQITFLDTPGHEAFSSMRERGSQITDVIIIVVAADDGVKPQTVEAIKHAKESGAPIIVAVNKMDKEGANPDLIKTQMAEYELSPIEWGGDTEFIEISAKTGKGIDDLLETIILQSEVLELKGNSKDLAKAAIVESSIQKGRGAVATIVIQNGTLSIGDFIVAGSNHGRVKAILNDQGKQIEKLGLSDTGVVVGLNGVPDAGEILVATKTDKEAKDFAEHRREHDRHKELSISTKTSIDELTAMIAEGNLKTLKVILRADVHGSLEAIKSSLEKLRNNEVKIDVISSGIGGITENDVSIANSSENAVILGFNVRPTGTVKANAKQFGIDIRTYSIIYELINDMTSMLTGLMSPVVREQNTGQAEVRDTFKIPSGGVVAGCMVVDGKLERGGYIRQIRDGVVLHTTTVSTLRRFKDDVKEVGKGYECGVGLDGIDDIVVGDILETFHKIEEKAKFDTTAN